MNHTVLVIAAHADDEVLGCGGTIAKHVDEEDTVHVLILTEPVDLNCATLLDARGASSVNKRYGQSPPRAAMRRRRAEAVACGEILGAHLHFANFPEVQTESYALTSMVDVVSNLVRETKPQIVYTHTSSDLNQDHRRTHEACMIALRPWDESSVRRVLLYQVDVVSGFSQTFRPTTYVPLTFSQAVSKQRALKQYASELREEPHPRSLTAVMHAMRHVGSKCRAAYAEEFSLFWER